MYAMLPKFDKDSPEYEEIIRRLKQCRKEQGAIIDATKGLVINPIPMHWSKYTKITEDMSEEEVAKAKFNNSILIDKRPQFMTNLYPNYSRDYKRYCDDWNVRSIGNFNIELKDLLAMDKKLLSEKQKEMVDKFYKYNPLLDSDCTMNMLSRYMQKRISEIKNMEKIKYRSKEKSDDLRDMTIIPDKEHTTKVYKLCEKYKAGKSNFGNLKNEDGSSRFKTIEQYNKFIFQEALLISSNVCELANDAVSRCYISYEHDNKEFVWSIFGNGIIDNLKKKINSIIKIPFADENGDIEFLGKKYSRMEIKINIEDINDFL
jgi:hypothetical protein